MSDYSDPQELLEELEALADEWGEERLTTKHEAELRNLITEYRSGADE